MRRDHFDIYPQAKCVKGCLSKPFQAGTVKFTCDGSYMEVVDDGYGRLIGDCSPNGYVSASGEFYFEPRIRYAETKRWTAEYWE